MELKFYGLTTRRKIFPLDAPQFKTYRTEMKKTQQQLAQLLGVSLKAVQGYEQGWRNIPPSVERQLFFLIYHLRKPFKNQQLCWIQKECHCTSKEKCPAFEFDMGHLCWFVNGTLCDGKPQSSWDQKIEKCRKCEMFRILL
jgi:transcriptional regulator with XRE-family HTH domain